MDDAILLQSLRKEVKAIKATLDEAKAKGQTLNEADTEFIIIDPILKQLGYGPLEISKRNHYGVTNNFPDYTVLADKPQKWFLEAKRFDLNLQDGEAAQAVNYANNQGAEWAVLTNGRKWYIYNAHLLKPLPEKRVLQIEDLFSEEHSLQILLLLSKPAILRNDLQEAWLFQQVTQLIDKQLKTPYSEVRKVIRKIGSEATKFDLTDNLVGKALLFVAPSPIASVADADHTASVGVQPQEVSAVPTIKQGQLAKTDKDFYTFDEIARDLTLATFRKPKAIKIGDHTENVKTWADVARMVVDYVGKASTLPPLPYSAGNKGKIYFLNSTPTHANDKPMQSQRVAVIGSTQVFIDTNRSTLNICACLVTLLETAGLPFTSIQVSIT